MASTKHRRPKRKATSVSAKTTGNSKRRTSQVERSGALPHDDTRAEHTVRTTARASKKGAVAALLTRAEGASLAEMMAATGWQAHSVRALLTDLRQQGMSITRTRDAEGVTRYQTTGAP